MIDWAKLASLRDDVGADELDEVVDLFLEEVGEAMAALPATASASDLSAKMHFLKGSALSLGFTDLAALCAKGEADPDAADVDAITACFEASRTTLRAEYGARLLG